MSPIKILHVVADSTQTGAPLQVYYLCKGLSETHSVHLACPNGWLADIAEKAGIQVYRLPVTPWKTSQIKYINYVISSVKPALVHCHGVRAGLWTRLAPTSGHRPIVYTEHLWTGDFHLKSRLRELIQLSTLRQLGHKTSYTIGVSDSVTTFMRAQGCTTKERSETIYCGLEPHDVLQPSSDSLHIGTLGSLTYIKNVAALIEATALVQQSTPLTLHIGGDGPDMEELKTLAKENSVHTVWHGQLQDSATFFKNLTIYVQPSLSESFGIAALEAMSCGIPTILSNRGGLKEVGGDAVLYSEPDTIQLAATIQRLSEDTTLQKQLRTRGPKRAHEFSVERMVTAHVQVYKKLL